MARKKQREGVNSTNRVQEIIQAAGKPIDPPAHVRLLKSQRPFFDNIIGELAKADWSPHMVEVAALLAIQMQLLAVEQRKLRKEGGTIEVRYGKAGEMESTLKPNPRAAVVKGMTADVLSYRRSLGLHARIHAGGGNNEDAAARRSQAKEIEDAVEEGGDEDDDLLA